MDAKTCPNCGAELKSGMFQSNTIVNENKISAVNEILGYNKIGYCDNCYHDLALKINNLKLENEKFIDQYIYLVPVITSHSPYGWTYKALGIVTGQTVTGTGVISEFASGWTDFFGQQSNSFIKKIASGEQMCLSQLRVKAIQMGGHAVISTDIDYGELGSVKGMIMVCAAGTAIELTDLSVLGDKQKIIAELKLRSDFLGKIYKYKLSE